VKIPVHLYSNLQRYTNDQSVVETEGSTVGQCLIHLIHNYPDISPIIFEKSGKLSSYVYISINLESARSETLERTLSEGDRIYIILIVAGG
jgi:sulfur-carrier protein